MKRHCCAARCVARLMALTLLAAGQAALAAPGDTTRVSVTSTGAQTNNDSGGATISEDGRFVVFGSLGSNLAAGDANGDWDVFIHDRQAGSTTLVSVSTGGGAGNSYSYQSSISADGRYVTFWSAASNLVATDTNGTHDVFVHDRLTGTTALVSVALGGGSANGSSAESSVSADGRYVAFVSSASNLVGGDTNLRTDAFVRDRMTSSTSLVSVALGGGAGNGWVDGDVISISADGRFVAFASDSSNLVAGDTNGSDDVFVRDLLNGSTRLVSVAVGGGVANGSSDMPSLSADGRYVVFRSDASNLVAGDTNGAHDVFVRDLQTGSTRLVSVATDGGPGNGEDTLPSYSTAISADGRFVVFYSDASNLVAGDTNGGEDVFVRDLQTGSTALVSAAVGGGVSNNDSWAPAISADGRVVAFPSAASNLVAGDTNGLVDVFVHELAGDSAGSLSLTLSKPLVAGCKSVSGRVTLSSPAPAGGANVTISDTLAAATPPATVKVAEGATTKSFTIKTVPVASNQSGTITVSLGSASASQPLTILPIGLSAVKLSPTTVVGGRPSTGTATLECNAGPGPVTVDLSTSNAAVASTVAPTVVVPQGLKSQTFTVATNPMLSKSSAMITGEASTTTKSRRLNVVPAAAVSPTRLAFGSVAVGQMSGAMVATLRNDGVVSFAVNSISLTGTYASWFTQTNSCPANLVAGASCTISVRFSPQAALSKSAKLSIATSATSTPLSVSLSGTGI